MTTQSELELEARKQLKKLGRLLANLERDRLEFLAWLQREPEAELLKTNLSKVRRGMEQVVLAPYVVKLDNTLAPKENLDKLFHHIRRARKGLAQVLNRQEETKLKMEELKKKIAIFETAPLEEMASGTSSATTKPIEAKKPNQKKSVEQQFRSLYHLFSSEANRPILVGKSAKDNMLLTFRVAKGNDWWFHVRDQPGSHVVVRHQGGELSQEQLLDAATLAVHYSKAKGERRAEVSYTQVKNLRRAPGKDVGRVLMTKEKTLLLSVEPERLIRLMATKA